MSKIDKLVNKLQPVKSHIMTKNVGNTDKLIRLLVAVILFLLVYTGKITGNMQFVALIVALIAAVTSLMNYCPLYDIFKINTNNKG